MAFSINEFWEDVHKATSGIVDYREACTKEVAGLNLDHTSRISESGFYESLQMAGVPHEVVNGLRKTWASQFDLFRQMDRRKTARTAPLKLFHLCVQSIADKFNRPLDKALAKHWIEFAVKPDDKHLMDKFLGTMERFGIDSIWTEMLASTWEFLFAPGGQSDMSAAAPNTFYRMSYEIGDDKDGGEVVEHVTFIHPFKADHPTVYIRQYREAELLQALKLLEKNPILVILGHPGWRPMLNEMDLWVEMLKTRLSTEEVHVLDMMETVKEPAEVKKEFGNGRQGAIFTTDRALVASGDEFTKFMAGQYFRPNRPENNPFTEPLRRLVIFASTRWQAHERVAKGLRPLLEEFGATEEVPILAIDHKLLNEAQAAQILFGERIFLDEDSDRAKVWMKRNASYYPLLPAHMAELAADLRRGMSESSLNRKISRATSKVHFMQNGNWGDAIDGIRKTAKANFLTIHRCPAPFHTFSMKIR